MDLVLKRTAFKRDGVFGELFTESQEKLCVTLEHAYAQTDGSFQAKLVPGQYVCMRGMHKLQSKPDKFETFEIMNVPLHTNILFHKGNYNIDSDGCVLLGLGLGSYNGMQIITASKLAFEKFMKLQDGLNSFKLRVE
jgi:hypothetical protein